MKIGILADIHEHVINLRSAIEHLRRENVDQIVVLGDVFEMGERIHETTDVLLEEEVIGVWGNHELAFCVDPEPQVVSKYGDRVCGFFRSLKPSLEIDGVRFSHGMPTWDARNAEVFYLGDPPWTPGSLDPLWREFDHPLFLIGHFHRWLVSTPEATLTRNAYEPVRFEAGQRYLVVIHAVCEGWCAVLDTETHQITPHSIANGHATPPLSAMAKRRS